MILIYLILHFNRVGPIDKDIICVYINKKYTEVEV